MPDLTRQDFRPTPTLLLRVSFEFSRSRGRDYGTDLMRVQKK
jgi:hypothetical protein